MDGYKLNRLYLLLFLWAFIHSFNDQYFRTTWVLEY